MYDLLTTVSGLALGAGVVFTFNYFRKKAMRQRWLDGEISAAAQNYLVRAAHYDDGKLVYFERMTDTGSEIVHIDGTITPTTRCVHKKATLYERVAEVTSEDEPSFYVSTPTGNPRYAHFQATLDYWNGGDEGEPLPAAMLRQPNVGGEGNPEYRGGNYVDPEEIAEEMKGIVRYHGDDQ